MFCLGSELGWPVMLGMPSKTSFPLSNGVGLSGRLTIGAS